MPLTLTQAQDDYIFLSMVNFLQRRVKAVYDPFVAKTSGQQEDYSTPLKLDEGTPDDPDIVNNPPIVAISTFPGSVGDKYFEIGGSIWRHMNFIFYCYPCLRIPDGAPSAQAAMILRTFMRQAFETESISILDYSNPAFNALTNVLYCPDNMLVLHATDPINRGMTTTLASEKHRFTMNVTMRYAVQGSILT